MLDHKIYVKRVETVQEFLNEKNAKFTLLTPSPNFEYLTGIRYVMRERLIALVIPRNGDPAIIAPAFEVSNLSRLTWIKNFNPWEEDEDPYSLVAGLVQNEPGKTVAFDETLPIGIFWSLQKSLDEMESIISLTPLLQKMRIIKTEAEIALMKKAGAIIDTAVQMAFNKAQVGLTELALRRILENEIVEHGATPTFAAVQFGDNSALPHAEAGNRTLQKGDIVLIDAGCNVEGYNTDMTRVGVVGNPTDEQQQIFEIVLRAQETALQQIGPGIQCGRADGFARRIIEKAGFGNNFTHRLGHGIGLEVHEQPYLVRGNSLELQSGMTHSVEPGIYLEGRFGIRIEDLVVIREDGCEAITYTPKQLFCIEIS